MRRAVTLIGLVLSAAVLGWIAHRFDLGAAYDNIVNAQWGWIILGAAVYVAAFPLRGLRWRVLLRSVEDVPTRMATEVFLVGALANNVLPARLGDEARALVLQQRALVTGDTE